MSEDFNSLASAFGVDPSWKGGDGEAGEQAKDAGAVPPVMTGIVSDLGRAVAASGDGSGCASGWGNRSAAPQQRDWERHVFSSGEEVRPDETAREAFGRDLQKAFDEMDRMKAAEGAGRAAAVSAAGTAPSVSAKPSAPLAAEGFAAREDEGLTKLGSQGTQYPCDYDSSVLETFVNKHQDNDYFVKFNCPEFTSLCPITGQPDFATIYISYVPDVRMVESKSLKLYLFSFRNHGDFHEDCMNIIMKDLIALMDPKYIEVWGKFTPRGGISIDPYCNYGRPGTKWEEVAWQRLSQHDLYPEKVDNR
ncbi:preQ(1) synthase [Parvibacter caecicola]|uniref:NADPH-dependent 7-cyano-7-deazaguanine reductase n=3 Tax=Parvibacter caecicola TaxID=747645 RepID=A0A7W5D290_9ACTN|nr:preQ(1) synthase [Parvibacter caecicola]MBB3171327.1 7-cyano-7-deazaguanine reductase [Parvibacter caecicola]MCR2041205.1 preQ(1) synthase [Parvibacter caecicola]